MQNKLKNLVDGVILRRFENANPLSLSLNFLQPLRDAIIVDSDHFWEITQTMLNGGWQNFIKHYLYASPDDTHEDYFPTLLLPGPELSTNRLDFFPLAFSDPMTIGDLLLRTAWVRGLKPQLVCYQKTPTEKKFAVLKFTYRSGEIPLDINFPPNIELLDKMLLQNAFELDASRERYPRGRTLFDLIEELTSNPSGFLAFRNKIKIDPNLHTSSFNFVYRSHSLAEFLDLLAYKTNSVWEWSDILGEPTTSEEHQVNTICFCLKPFTSGYFNEHRIVGEDLT